MEDLPTETELDTLESNASTSTLKDVPKQLHKRMKILDQTTYDLVVSYKISPKNVPIDKRESKLKNSQTLLI
jgi:hypothetical protein